MTLHIDTAPVTNERRDSEYSASSTPISPLSPLPQDTTPLIPAGCQPDDLYKRLMPKWRYEIRSKLVQLVHIETPIIAKIQTVTKYKLLDHFFLWSAILGTHSAFMIGLPFFWWFGGPEAGIGPLNVSAFGIYFSSYLKDLFCVPRPFSPPIDRMTIGSHALEYGFLSSHSTNAISLALYAAQRTLEHLPADSWEARTAFGLALLYGISVPVGRVHAGMHSFMDITAGSILGVILWAANYYLQPILCGFLHTKGFTVPFTVIPICLFFVTSFPDPCEDCPCFSDAVAFISVVMGVYLARWTELNYNLDVSYTSAGTPFAFDDNTIQWYSIAVAKIAMGVAAVFTWRIIAKAFLQQILPPIFILVQPYLELPRRHYIPARTYRRYRAPTISEVQTIPSVLNIPATLEKPVSNDSGYSSSRRNQNLLHPQLQNRSKEALRSDPLVRKITTDEPRPPKLVRYDADVLIKVIVYSGIGYIACLIMPWFFTRIGLSAS